LPSFYFRQILVDNHFCNTFSAFFFDKSFVLYKNAPFCIGTLFVISNKLESPIGQKAARQWR
jgi:hypothetical protein